MNPLISSGMESRRGVTALSVNLNRVALLRNSRPLDIPNVVQAATWVLQAGAQGITIHPRPDQRHIRMQDVFDLAALMKQWPQAEFNIEGNPHHNLMDLMRELSAQGLCPHQCTFVPDSADQVTSDHGWGFPKDAAAMRPLIAEVHAMGARVSLFMDPEPQAMAAVREVGADRVEIYTESYARAHGTAAQAEVLAGYTATARAALVAGLGINAGHDLNRVNLAEFLMAVPGVQEVSIGHALMADAIELGLGPTVKAYLRCIHQAT
jgi:pyridoxine 5-phosphate synthase